ncbi:MAG: type II/IV secretion system protein [Candidatus Liptonbacteria bacterium]|nr:type II/IV secretion system protein [Candidatus Liptonbacteria bacterium]
MTTEQLLGEIQKQGLINEETSNKLKRESLLSGRSVEDLIYSQRLLDDTAVANIKSEILKIPYQKVDVSKLDENVLGTIPEETVRTYGAVPISKNDNLLVVGMIHPDDPKAQEALKFIARRLRLNLGVYLISYSDWQNVLKKYSPYKSEVEAAVRSLNLKSESAGRPLVRLDEAVSSNSDDAPIIKIVAKTFSEAVQRGASDVHIEPLENYLRVRFRIDGRLKEEISLPAELSQAVVSRVKVMSNLKIDETRVPQDGRFRTRVFDREIDFRVSTFPTPMGEKVAIRVLDPSVGLKSFDQLGLEGNNLEIVKEALLKPFGMILLTGPTGSGKTTTLYALLQGLNKENVNILSLEDPVEYFIPGLNQSQVRPEIGYDFASGLREILRQDPDIIMVGEIRDNETAGLAVHAALTGHIVLSTLHTNDAVGVIPRLIDMKVEPFLLPSALNLMVSQRLVGKLCQDCEKPETAPAEIQKIIKKELSGLPPKMGADYSEPYKIYKSQGCAKCQGRGIVGRIAIFEILKMSKELEGIVNSGPTAQRIYGEARRQGMATLRQDGILKALSGLISIEEVIGETQES